MRKADRDRGRTTQAEIDSDRRKTTEADGEAQRVSDRAGYHREQLALDNHTPPDNLEAEAHELAGHSAQQLVPGKRNSGRH